MSKYHRLGTLARAQLILQRSGAWQDNSPFPAANRHATLLWYMNTVKSGGETIFPLVGRYDGSFEQQDQDVTSLLESLSPGIQEGTPGERAEELCRTASLKVAPLAGTAVLFYDMLPSGAVDKFSAHAACKVGEGSVKWAANKWTWSSPLPD